MSLSFIDQLLQRLPHPRWPLLIYAATWTAVLTVTVAIASFTPELAFVYSAVRPAPPNLSSAQPACRQHASVRLPLDIPSEVFCFPGRFFKRSRLDMLVPPVFAGVIVAGSACVIKAIGLWEAEDDEQLLV